MGLKYVERCNAKIPKSVLLDMVLKDARNIVNSDNTWRHNSIITHVRSKTLFPIFSKYIPIIRCDDESHFVFCVKWLRDIHNIPSHAFRVVYRDDKRDRVSYYIIVGKTFWTRRRSSSFISAIEELYGVDAGHMVPACCWNWEVSFMEPIDPAIPRSVRRWINALKKNYTSDLNKVAVKALSLFEATPGGEAFNFITIPEP